ncbi:ABC-F family ATP-binding cassette domain-containing protein [Lapidilactobacillus mulanensis]|uniref:ABC-F family ATP-binding cassette domain-containing protein n=1 Tax=Lapidilactobacillus mulanensis TaxID=2485999 RepID=A0ABW4DQS7_9LACO|nr:ABC-F family ATP-binding cassette domain-containing protein [Lapidilactobacillus mulanensis]
MSILTVTNLSHSFADKTLYENANFKIERQDHMGIVGQNGVGKSTLIKILTGELLPDEGKVVWQKNTEVGYLDQYANLVAGMTIFQFLQTAFSDLFDIEAKMNHLYEEYATNMDDDLLEKAGRMQTHLEESGFYDLDTEIVRVASGLGLDDIGLDHDVSQLSGGQRSKVILTKLLLQKPDMLVLDEPTNYLDTKHIDWLVGYLVDFPGAFLVISHDYEFLERITNSILDIEFGQITRYTGDLKTAFRQKEADAQSYRRAYSKQQEQIAKSKAYIRRFKAGTRAKSAKSREKQLSHLDVLKKPDHLSEPTIQFRYQPTDSRMLLTTQDLYFGYDQALNKLPLDISIAGDEKILVSGYNGIGKSTFLKTILGILPKIGGDIDFSPSLKIAYYDQSLRWPHKLETPLQYMQNAYELEKPKVLRQYLAKTGLTAQQVLSPLVDLSGGEQAKVKLAEVMMKPANLLILDEPTNHLDDLTKDALNKGIQSFEGAVLLVTHETNFYDESWLDKVIDIEKLQ